MKKKVRPSVIKGSVQAPPSKSFAQRAIAIATMAVGQSEIIFPGFSEDVRAAISVAGQLGAEVGRFSDRVIINGNLIPPEKPLDCGEAGLSVRMFSSVASVFGEPVTLTGRGSLLRRPMDVIENSIRAMGVRCETNRGYLPVTVCGPINGGVAHIDGAFSSQVLTGMLIAAPFAGNDLTIKVSNLKSRPYIDITLAVMKSFGVDAINNGYEEFVVRSGQRYRPTSYLVEGDWSAAAFLLVAGAVAGSITVDNIDAGSPQADRSVLRALESAGALFSVTNNSVSVSSSPLSCFRFDATDCPDLFPPLVSLAAACKGRTRIAGVGRLEHKESNRAVTLKEEFGKMGIEITIEGDEMIINGGVCTGGTVFSHGDHRIAMACAIAALAGKGEVLIEGAEAVAKSYPGFFEDIDKLIK